MKFGIVGYGGMGAYHVELLQDLAVMSYDIDENRQKLAKKRSLIVCSSYDQMLASDQIDTVLIATPNDSHFDLAKKALESRKNVLLEKPATINSLDFQKLIRIASINNQTLTVHQNRRFDNDFLAVSKIVSNQEIGRVYKIESSVVAANGLPGEWRKIKAHGGGMILDWGVHLVDQAVTLFGKNIDSVYCRNSYIYGEDVDDGFYCELSFDCGVVYCITVDTNSFVTKPRFQVFGDKGSAQIVAWEQPIEIVRVVGEENNICGIKAGNGFTKTMAKRNVDSLDCQKLPLENVPKNIFYSNMDKIKNDEVLYVLQILENMQKSSDENQVIKLRR